MIHFDNTKKIKDSSKVNEEFVMSLLTVGNETQKFNIGQKVDGNGNGFKNGIITDVYEENGYIRYEVEYKLDKKYKKILRQQDISII
jgi:hypothetical protein